MKNGKEEKGLKKVTKIFLFLGCGMLFAAALLHGITTYQQNRMLAQYKKYLEQEKIKKGESAEKSESNKHDYLKEEYKEDETKNSIKKKIDYEEGDTIGILKIPKLDLETALLEGVEKETLKYAVGHFPQTAQAGEQGNCCIIGHRSYTYGETFSRLNEMEQGDLFSIQTKEGEFFYKVVSIRVVEPSEISVLDKTEEEQVTLITCTPLRIGTHRFIVVGKRI